MTSAVPVPAIVPLSCVTEIETTPISPVSRNAAERASGAVAGEEPESPLAGPSSAIKPGPVVHPQSALGIMAAPLHPIFGRPIRRCPGRVTITVGTLHILAAAERQFSPPFETSNIGCDADESCWLAMANTRPWEANWKFVKNLSGGGQGTTQLVSSVVDPNRLGVLKTLVSRNKQSPQARGRMRVEVASLDVLAKQGIKVPEVYEGNTDQHADLNAELYFVMEYIPGKTLKKEVTDRGPLPLEKVVAIANELCGTHVDAPIHFIAGGNSVDEIPPARLVGPLVVIDAQQAAAANPDLEITLDDVRRWEKAHNEIPSSSFVVAHTGWWKKWNTPKEYINLGQDGRPHFPGFSSDAAQYLVQTRKAAGLGIDTLSIDPGVSKEFPAHRVVLKTGAINIENVTNLDGIPEAGGMLVVAPLRIGKGSGAPARVIALVPRQRSQH